MAEKNQPSLINRIRYRKDDPRRYLTVPVEERLTTDTGPESDARNDVGGTNEEGFDREEVRKAGIVIPEKDLQ